MATITRTTETRNSNTEREPAKYYLNLYAGKNQLGYLVLDAHPDIVKFLQENPDDGVERMLKNLTGTFREAGSRTVSYDTASW